MRVDWNMLIPVWISQSVWVTIIVASTVLLVKRMIQVSVRREMAVVISIVNRKLETGNVYLVAAEQMARLQTDRNADDKRGQSEFREHLKHLIRKELEGQQTLLLKSTQTVVQKMDEVADKVVERVVASATDSKLIGG